MKEATRIRLEKRQAELHEEERSLASSALTIENKKQERRLLQAKWDALNEEIRKVMGN